MLAGGLSISTLHCLSVHTIDFPTPSLWRTALPFLLDTCVTAPTYYFILLFGVIKESCGQNQGLAICSIIKQQCGQTHVT